MSGIMVTQWSGKENRKTTDSLGEKVGCIFNDGSNEVPAIETSCTQVKGVIFNIERYAIHDGPGIRTLVFMKGCPLRCLWCQNPEGLKREPGLIWLDQLCTRCFKCIKDCPESAITIIDEDGIEIDLEKCSLCGKCVGACNPRALTICGRYMSADEVIKEVIKDEAFYRASGGGVTISGGEPLMQSLFVLCLLKECKRYGIHTAIETSGYAKWDLLKKIAEYTDLFLYDVKHLCSKKHKEYTGTPNSLILRNLEKLSELKKEIIVRVPVIPGYNDSEENMEELCIFMKKSHLLKVNLLPYNPLAESKYEKLGVQYALKGLQPPNTDKLKKLKAIADFYGIQCKIL